MRFLMVLIVATLGTSTGAIANDTDKSAGTKLPLWTCVHPDDGARSVGTVEAVDSKQALELCQVELRRFLKSGGQAKLTVVKVVKDPLGKSY